MFLAVHSIIVIALVSGDARAYSYGFALIPIFILDVLVLPLFFLIEWIFPQEGFSHTNFAIQFLVLGGLQWYLIGWVFQTDRKVGNVSLRNSAFIVLSVCAALLAISEIVGLLHLWMEEIPRLASAKVLVYAAGFSWLAFWAWQKRR